MQNNEITLLSEHVPALKSGNYTIDVTQDVEDDNSIKETFNKKFHFKVESEEYIIGENLINHLFPPHNSVGDYSNVFPHIVLERSTLPWERTNIISTGTDLNTPWIALLLLKKEEILKEEVCNIKNLTFLDSKGKPWEVISSDEKNAATNRLIKVISVRKPLVDDKLVPSSDELKHLTHVRVSDTNERAVVVCNRVPFKGEENILHLVSLHHHISSTDSSYYQYISLKSWSFFCTDHFKITFEALDRMRLGQKINNETIKKIENLEGSDFFSKETISAALQKLMSKEDNIEDIISYFHFGTFKSTLLHLNKDVLRFPKQQENPNIKQGYIPLPHYFIKENNSLTPTISWYRGPLIPYKLNWQPELPASIKASKTLLIYKNEESTLDISYASAWELGRLAAIKDKRFATELFKWKRDVTHRNLSNTSNTKSVYSSQKNEFPELTPLLKDKLTALNLLQDIPFNYLVPEESMLPVESIRFFFIDNFWRKCLIEGAFSLGGSIPDKIKNSYFGSNSKINTGFLMRSDVINGWPDMIIEAYNDEKAIISFNKFQLSENVIFCIFQDVIKQVVFHLPNDVIHWGFSIDDNGWWVKDNKIINSNPSAGNNIVNITNLVNLFNVPNSAQFAKQMIEGPQSVVIDLNLNH